MPDQPLIVPAAFLLERQAEWNDGHVLFGPREIADGLPEHVMAKCEVIVTGSSLPPGLVEALPKLKLVACFATGIEGVDHAMLGQRGVAVTTAAGINAHDVADHAMALMLARWHMLLPGDQMVRAGQWSGFRRNVAPRRSLRGRHAGIVGLGRIGEQIARRAAAHGMEVRWWGPRKKPDCTWRQCSDLSELAGWADVMFVAARSAPENAGLVGKEIIEALGPQGLLVNVSRGMLVDEQALIAALESGALGGAALDVFAEEPTDPARWAGLGDKVVLAPHTAGFTQEAGRDLFGQLRENVRRHFAGEPLLTPLAG